MDPIKPEARSNWHSPYYSGFQRTIDTLKRNYEKIKYIPRLRDRILFDGVEAGGQLNYSDVIPEIPKHTLEEIRKDIKDDINQSPRNQYGTNDVHYNYGLTLLAAQDAAKSSSQSWKVKDLLHGDFFTSMLADPMHKKNALETLFQNMGTVVKKDTSQLKSSILTGTYNPFETIYDIGLASFSPTKYLKHRIRGTEDLANEYRAYDANSSQTSRYITDANEIEDNNFKAIAQNLKTMMEHELRSKLGSQYNPSLLAGYIPKLTIYSPIKYQITKKTVNRNNTGFDYNTREFFEVGIRRIGHGFMGDNSTIGRSFTQSYDDENSSAVWDNEIQNARRLFLINQANKYKWSKTMDHFKKYLDKTVGEVQTAKQAEEKQQKEIDGLVTALRQQNQQLRDQQSQYSELFNQNQKTYNELIEQMKGLATNQYTNSMSGLEDLKDFPYNVRKNKLILGAMPSVENAGDFFAGYLNN